MSVQGYEIASEVAYDLMQDHLETILALLDRPMTRDEVVCRLGSETVLERMVTHGLVKMEEGRLRAASDMYCQLRQEGMMTFLQRYVLPSLAANIQGNCAGMLANRYLRLAPKALCELRRGRVQALFDELWQISERRALGETFRLSILVVGTSRIVSGQPDEAQQALVHLKQACMQRASLAERDDAVLLQFDCLADLDRYLSAERAVQKFITSFENERAKSADEASHHLTVASHWRCVNAGGCGVTGTRAQPC